MNEYPRPWRTAYHLAWFVRDARDGIVAGPFENIGTASAWLEAWPNPSQPWERGHNTDYGGAFPSE